MCLRLGRRLRPTPHWALSAEKGFKKLENHVLRPRPLMMRRLTRKRCENAVSASPPSIIFSQTAFVFVSARLPRAAARGSAAQSPADATYALKTRALQPSPTARFPLISTPSQSARPCSRHSPAFSSGPSRRPRRSLHRRAASLPTLLAEASPARLEAAAQGLPVKQQPLL